MKKKKMLTLALAGMMIFTSIPGNVNAAIQFENQESKGNQDTQEALEKVILKVKKLITIPKDCTVFSYDFNTYNYGKEAWSLYWNNKEGNRYIYVQCDNDGNITYYNDSNYEDKRKPKLNYIKSELEATSLEYLNKIYPSMKDCFRLTSSGYDGTYENSYSYIYERVENKIGMPDNTVTISISAEDKSLKSIYCNIIFGVDIPDAKKEISKEKAAELLRKNLTMSLGYYNKVETLSDGTEKIKAYLAYRPNVSYISVDAKTGEVYTDRTEWKYTSSHENMTGEAKDSATRDYDQGLTEEEISKIEELSNLISKEDAIAKITKNKYLLLDNTAKEITASLTQRDTYLSKKEGTKTDYYWNISFLDPRKPDYNKNDIYRATANAVVNAKTGEIISYYASTKTADYENSDDLSKYKEMYADKKCQQIFETFVASINKERFKETKLVSTFDEYIVAYNDKTRIVGGLGYHYSRFNQDIEYSYNYIYGDVDKVTGKVYRYGYIWNDNVEFESKKGVISEEEAYDAFIKLDGFDLVYEYNTIHTYNTDYLNKEEYYYNEDAYSLDYEVRLVYSIEGIYPKIISPFTKKQLDYDGKVYVKKANITAYTDISNSPYQRSIQLLTDMGLGYTGSKFNPDSQITVDDLITFTQAAGLYFDNNLRKKVFNQYYVNRQTFAKYICYLMNVEEIASLPGIFTTGYVDESVIQKDYVGFVAITKAMSLLSADSEGKFNPQQNITRGEAAELLIQLIQKK